MSPGDGRRKGKPLEVPVAWELKSPKKSNAKSVCWLMSTFSRVWMPANGELVEVGRDGQLKHSDKSLILHKTISCFSLLKIACVQNEFKRRGKTGTL